MHKRLRRAPSPQAKRNAHSTRRQNEATKYSHCWSAISICTGIHGCAHSHTESAKTNTFIHERQGTNQTQSNGGEWKSNDVNWTPGLRAEQKMWQHAESCKGPERGRDETPPAAAKPGRKGGPAGRTRGADKTLPGGGRRPGRGPAHNLHSARAHTRSRLRSGSVPGKLKPSGGDREVGRRGSARAHNLSRWRLRCKLRMMIPPACLASCIIVSFWPSISSRPFVLPLVAPSPF